MVWVALQSTPDGDELVSAHLAEHKKVRNIRNDPRVAVTIVSLDGSGQGMRPYLSITGTARIVEGGAPELLKALNPVLGRPEHEVPAGRRTAGIPHPHPHRQSRRHRALGILTSAFATSATGVAEYSGWVRPASSAGICGPVHCVKPCAAWRFTSKAAPKTGKSPVSAAIATTSWSRGHLCPKGVSLGALHHDPDRIRRPLIKVDGRWQEVSWDAAFRRCTELLSPVIDEVRDRRGDRLHRQPAGALVLPGPLRGRADGHVRDAGHVFAGDGRPMAEESVVAPDVRPLVELPRARHRAHRPAGHHGRQPRRVAGFAAGRAQRDGSDQRDSQTRQGDRDRPGAHPTAAQRRRVASDRAGHRRGAAAGRRAYPL